MSQQLLAFKDPITLETSDSNSLLDIINDALRIARAMTRLVRFKYAGVVVTVSPGDVQTEVLREFERLRFPPKEGGRL